MVLLAIVGVLIAKETTRTTPAQQSPAKARQTGKSSEGLTSQPAQARAAPDKKPQGPLPGSELADSLKSGRPTLADFGKDWCVPCRMMVPVLKQAARDYRGKANVVFVNLEQYPDLGTRHRIAAMPTQILFDGKGKEIKRHMGYIGTEDIERELAALGVKK